MNRLRVGSVCSGVGCPEQALKNLGIPFEVTYYCEIDRQPNTEGQMEFVF